MHNDGDDDLCRTFTLYPPRRTLLAAVASGLLAILPSGLGLTKAAAKRKRKKKKGRERRGTAGTLPPPPSPPPPCVPNCNHKICGDDGCGGSCGACTDGEVCAGGLCQSAGTCQPDDNICTNTSASPIGCNGVLACDCVRRFADDALICGNLAPGGCDSDCRNDSDCGGFGPGAFCVRKIGPKCCLPTPLNQGICAIRCAP